MDLMAMASGLLALAVLGADGSSVDCGGAIPFQVRVMTLDGLEWRTEAYAKLKPVARQGTSSIWTADRALAESLAASARSVTVTPKCSLGGDQSVTLRSPVYYQAHWERVADGPINHATKLAWRPETSKVEEGFRAQVACRKLDQGILARVQIEESHVNAIHKVLQAENFKTPNGMKVDFVPPGKGESVIGFQVIEQAANGKESALGCYVQVPEVSGARIEGEWLVPTDAVLVVTLGVDTVADDQGKAVVRERVAVIEFGEGAPAVKEEAKPADRAEVAPAVPPVLVGALPMPATPSRSYPEAFDPAGKLVDLPPLPEGLAADDLDRIKPAPDQPSPQTIVSNASAADASVSRTSFVPDAVAAPSPSVQANVPIASAPSSCFLRKLIASGMAEGYDIDVNAEDDGKTLRFTVNRCSACEDVGCKVDAEARPTAAAPGPKDAGIDLSLVRSAFLGKVFSAFDKLGATPDDCPECADCPESKAVTALGFAAAARAFDLADDQATSPPAPAVEFGVNVRDADGKRIASVDNTLGAVLKNPGKTETTYVPLPGKFSLELKATVVPSKPDHRGEAEMAVRKSSRP